MDFEWVDRQYVLRWFGEKSKDALREYNAFISEGVSQGKRSELVGGGMLRSLGGWSAVKGLRRQGEFEKCDVRILGSGEFVEALLNEADEKVRYQLPKTELIAEARLRMKRLCATDGVPFEQLIHGCRKKAISSIRSRLAIELTTELGLSMAETARLLGVSTFGIARILKRNNLN